MTKKIELKSLRWPKHFEQIKQGRYNKNLPLAMPHLSPIFTHCLGVHSTESQSVHFPTKPFFFVVSLPSLSIVSVHGLKQIKNEFVWIGSQKYREPIRKYQFVVRRYGERIMFPWFRNLSIFPKNMRHTSFYVTITLFHIQKQNKPFQKNSQHFEKSWTPISLSSSCLWTLGFFVLLIPFSENGTQKLRWDNCYSGQPLCCCNEEDNPWKGLQLGRAEEPWDGCI